MNPRDEAVRDDAAHEEKQAESNAESNEVEPLIREPLSTPISRRTAIKRLRILAGGVALVAAAEICGAGLVGLYDTRSNAFGGPMHLGRKTSFPAATPQDCKLDQAGVFYRPDAHSFIVHLSAQTPFRLSDGAVADALGSASIMRAGDGSYWLALNRACVHDGTTVRFFVCGAFNCPNCGASYACDGEYIDGPAPRSLDRFPVSFKGDNVVVDTGRLNSSVDRPSIETRLLLLPTEPCWWHLE